MKIQACKSKTVFVMSGDGGGGACPRMILRDVKTTIIRDDYQGNVSIDKSLLSKLCLF